MHICYSSFLYTIEDIFQIYITVHFTTRLFSTYVALYIAMKSHTLFESIASILYETYTTE